MCSCLVWIQEERTPDQQVDDFLKGILQSFWSGAQRNRRVSVLAAGRAEYKSDDATPVPKSKIGRDFWLGRARSHSPVDHRDASQSRESASSRMQKRADKAFLGACYRSVLCSY